MKRFNGILCVLLVLCCIVCFGGSYEEIMASQRTSKSKYTKEKYTHQEQFDECKIFNGIDVSSYQGDINWTKVKAAKVQFAMIRVGHRRGDSGEIDEDAYYQTNIESAIANKINVGVYIFSQAITVKEAKEEAKYLIERIKGYDITMPVVIDYEFESTKIAANGGRLKKAKLSKAKATKIVRAFCKVVKKAGYTPMVYANANMLNNYLNAEDISKDYKIWHARYANSTNTDDTISYTGQYDMWQYSSKGKVKGIKGYVDCDFWYKNLNVTVNKLKLKKRTTDTIKLKWAKKKSASGYKIYRYNKKKGKYLSIGTSATNSYTDETVKSAKTYKYKVKAYWVIGGKKYYSKASEVVKITTKPGTPQNLKASSVKKNKLTIKWSKVKRASGYYVYRYSKKKKKYEKIATIESGKTCKYTDKDLKSNKTYKYKVVAYKTTDEETLKSAKSQVLEVKTKKSSKKK